MKRFILSTLAVLSLFVGVRTVVNTTQIEAASSEVCDHIVAFTGATHRLIELCLDDNSG